MGVVEFYVWGIILVGVLQGGRISQKLHRGEISVAEGFAGVPFDRMLFHSLVWPAVVVIMTYYIYSTITGGKVFKEAEMLLEQEKLEREATKLME